MKSVKTESEVVNEQVEIPIKDMNQGFNLNVSKIDLVKRSDKIDKIYKNIVNKKGFL